jgi:hypothetical protein
VHAIRRIAVVAALALAFFPARADAATVDDLKAAIRDAQNGLVQAAGALTPDDATAAGAALGTALGFLDAAGGMLEDPGIEAALGTSFARVGKALQKTGKKAAAAQAALADPAAPFKKRLSKLKAASKSALAAGLKLGKPVIGQIGGKNAGFHKPGDVVRFQIYAADGTPCLEAPEITVENAPLSSAVDTGSVSVDETTGIITLTMGTGRGGGSVSVTACGQTSTVLLYNYGPPSIPGIPDGFPRDLPPGNYELVYSASGEVTIPPTSLGVFPLVDFKLFAKTLIQAFNQAVAATQPPGNCTQGVNYGSYAGNSFSITYTVTCTVDDVTSTQTTTFTVTKQ